MVRDDGDDAWEVEVNKASCEPVFRSICTKACGAKEACEVVVRVKDVCQRFRRHEAEKGRHQGRSQGVGGGEGAPPPPRNLGEPK